MAAKNKAELLAVTHKEYDKLEKLIPCVDAGTALEGGSDDTSIKDIIAHRAHWIELFLGWYSDGLAGKAVHFPAEGYKWSDLKRYNADLRARQANIDWTQAVELLRTNYKMLVTFIEARSEAELYGGPMKGANNAWTAGRWAEAAGPGHFRSASKYLRSAIRTRSSM